jgi:hypothetical protein
LPGYRMLSTAVAMRLANSGDSGADPADFAASA